MSRPFFFHIDAQSSDIPHFGFGGGERFDDYQGVDSDFELLLAIDRSGEIGLREFARLHCGLHLGVEVFGKVITFVESGEGLIETRQLCKMRNDADETFQPRGLRHQSLALGSEGGEGAQRLFVFLASLFLGFAREESLSRRSVGGLVVVERLVEGSVARFAGGEDLVRLGVYGVQARHQRA
jgi:hypothetical protein